jgi:hypothetical protein
VKDRKLKSENREKADKIKIQKREENKPKTYAQIKLQHH